MSGFDCQHGITTMRKKSTLIRMQLGGVCSSRPQKFDNCYGCGTNGHSKHYAVSKHRKGVEGVDKGGIKPALCMLGKPKDSIESNKHRKTRDVLSMTLQRLGTNSCLLS